MLVLHFCQFLDVCVKSLPGKFYKYGSVSLPTPLLFIPSSSAWTRSAGHRRLPQRRENISKNYCLRGGKVGSTRASALCIMRYSKNHIESQATQRNGVLIRKCVEKDACKASLFATAATTHFAFRPGSLQRENTVFAFRRNLR